MEKDRTNPGEGLAARQFARQLIVLIDAAPSPRMRRPDEHEEQPDGERGQGREERGARRVKPSLQSGSHAGARAAQAQAPLYYIAQCRTGVEERPRSRASLPPLCC